MNQRDSRSRSYLWVAGGVGLIILLGYVLVLALGEGIPRIVGDASQYLRLTENLVRGRGFSFSSQAPYEPTAGRVPGYPLFLIVATLGMNLPLFAVAVGQATLHAAVGALVAGVLSRGGVTPILAGAGGLLAGVVPPMTDMATVLLTESLATFLGIVAVGVVSLGLVNRSPGRPERGSRLPWVAAGLAIGLGALVRPELLGLGPLLALVVILGPGAPRLRLLRTGLLVGALILPILPWAARNYARFQRPVVTAAIWDWAPRGYVAWAKTWMAHPRYVQPALWDVWPRGQYDPEAFPSQAFAGSRERAQVDSLLSQEPPPIRVGSSTDSLFGALARERTLNDPLGTLGVVPLKRIALTVLYLPTAFAPPESPLKVGSPPTLSAAFRFPYLVLEAAAGINLLIFMGGLVGAGVTCLPRFRWALPFAVLLGYRFMVVGWLALPEPRYVVEALPAAAFLSALAMYWFATRAGWDWAEGQGSHDPGKSLAPRL